MYEDGVNWHFGIAVIVCVILIFVFYGEVIMDHMGSRLHKKRRLPKNASNNKNLKKEENKNTNVSKKDAQTFLEIIELLDEIYKG